MMSHEDLEKAKAERVAKGAVRVAKKAAKEAYVADTGKRTRC